LTTQLGGDTEPFVRLAAPLLNAGTAATVVLAGTRLFGGWTGLLAGTVYCLMPGVQLSSGVITTDAPVLMFAGLTLLAYLNLRSNPDRHWAAVLLGAAIGAAMLSKYAAIYLILGIVLHAVVDKEARRIWNPLRGLLVIGSMLILMAPNVFWNFTHGFETVSHTAANANWQGSMFNPRQLLAFLGSQFAVFGPVPFLVLVIGSVTFASRNQLSPDEKLLASLVLPALVAVTLQAFLSRAHANWAAISYVPGSVLAAHWMMRWKPRPLIITTLVSQGLIAALFLVSVLSPPTADKLGLSNSFKRAKGWSSFADMVVRRAEAEQMISGLSAITVDDRFLFNSLAYYGREYFEDPGSAPLTIWTDGPAGNQAEANTPLTVELGRRVLVASLEGQSRPRIDQDFASISGLEISRVRLDRKRSRRTELFIGDQFRPKTGP
jgi:4-amino-4-deoxy-L-arabinose transferase-like glycosyltransferase